jgi:hypothetical protein
MKKVILLTVLLLIIEQINAQTWSLKASYPLKQTDIDLFVNAHNAIRKAYGCGPVTWDATLASDSQAYANLCKGLTHSAANGAYGENLSYYQATPEPTKGFPYKTMDYHPVSGWYTSEEPFWNCAKNSCNTTTGGMCGHLTQIVWCATTTIGCGVANCLQTGSKNWYIQHAVCRYKSPGNYVGQHPLGDASKCPKQPTTIGPLTPTAPTQPVAPPPTPIAPAPVKPVPPPSNPVAPPTTPVTPPTAPVAPVASPTSTGIWWSGCIANYWPTDSTGKQYQKLTPCAWEPWKDTSSGQTWCCPNPNDENDYSWPCYNLKPGVTTGPCPDGKAASYALAEESASQSTDLPMGAWIGIAIGIAVIIIIIIVVIVIVQKKKNDERV